MAETIPLSVPDDLLAEVRTAAEESNVSMQDVFRQSTRLGLPKFREQHSQASGRITNVDPLPDEVLERIYSAPERDEEGIERLVKAQPKGVRD
jgi:hypothetical protein